MKMYFVLPNAFKLTKDDQGKYVEPTDEQLTEYLNNEINTLQDSEYDALAYDVIAGYTTIEDAKLVANEYDAQRKDDEFFPVVEIELNEDVVYLQDEDRREITYNIDEKNTGKVFAYDIEFSKFNMEEPAQYHLDKTKFNEDQKQGFFSTLKGYVASAYNSAKNQLTMRNALFAGLAVAAVAVFNLPAVLGITGLSLIGKLAATVATFFGLKLASHGATKAYNYFSNSNESEENNNQNENQNEDENQNENENKNENESDNSVKSKINNFIKQFGVDVDKDYIEIAEQIIRDAIDQTFGEKNPSQNEKKSSNEDNLEVLPKQRLELRKKKKKSKAVKERDIQEPSNEQGFEILPTQRLELNKKKSKTANEREENRNDNQRPNQTKPKSAQLHSFENAKQKQKQNRKPKDDLLLKEAEAFIKNCNRRNRAK